jgi:hypothetical protein
MDKKNASYGLAVSRVARVLNHFTAHHVSHKRVLLHVPHWYRLRKRLLERINSSSALGARATPERLLGASTARWIRERNWDSNRRLSDLTGIDLRSYGYPFDPPASPAPRPSGGLAQHWLSL